MSRVSGRAPLRPDDPRHGTWNGYGNLGCRCERCREANRVTHAAYMQRPGRMAVHRAREKSRHRGEAVWVPYDPDALGAAVTKSHQRTPRTLQEWQYAADLAELALSIDAARQFGLVTGGPNVNTDRCAFILDEAAKRRIEPAPPDGLLREFVAGLSTPPDTEEGNA